MSGYGEPDWVNSQQNSATVDEANISEGVTAAQAPSSSSKESGVGKGGCALCMLSLMNMGLAALMSALGVLTLIEVHRTGFRDLSEPFLASYMILFALLLFLYEIMWWSPFPAMNKSMRKNFGFMYGLRGKGLYIIFVAFLCFGLGKDASIKEMNYATGAAFLAGGLLHFFVIFFHPELAMKYQAPTAGLLSDSAATNNDNVV
ncbi:COPI associated protein [Nitzschia inconspicua]|uniref:COPI associated protein n=1 Tax=Nitzschia inconspicua TaxID=303405 RepID=A0A9K3LU17_9STRA|nr:COPI associated protein [Nitzschia inconspicua]